MQASNFTYFLALIVLFISCQSNSSSGTHSTLTKLEGTGDAKSLEIAEKVMESNGGLDAWESTRFIQWNFFGSRKHIWDKQTNNLIIEGIKDTFKIEMNLSSLEGTVHYNGVQQSHPDSLIKYLEKGKQMWNNDAYWLLMPYKLRDPGVDLKYLGLSTYQDRADIHKIEMTFKEVGDTPQNKYHVYIDPISYRVIQWEFFPDVSDEKSRFATPWTDYKQYGNIWLSSSRGENYLLSEIAVDTPELAALFN